MKLVSSNYFNFCKLLSSFSVPNKIVILCLASLAAAGQLPPIAILRQTAEAQDGSYHHRWVSVLAVRIVWRCIRVDKTKIFYSFVAENGIEVEEKGANKQIDPENAGMTSSGSYSYTAPDGTLIKVTWIADENGFRAFGDHLPVDVSAPLIDVRVKPKNWAGVFSSCIRVMWILKKLTEIYMFIEDHLHDTKKIWKLYSVKWPFQKSVAVLV